MSDSNKDPHPAKPGLSSRVDELREVLQPVPANLLAERTGSSYQNLGPGRGEFRFSLFDSPVYVSYPALIAFDASNDEELSLPVQAAIAYYFHTSDGAPLTGQWVSFAELPDGRIYNQAFQGYTGDDLVRTFLLDLERFKSACEKSGGVAALAGDAAYIFYALPRLPILVNYWCGDEEFPSSCKILFDTSVHHYLPTEVCAILGSMLTRRLIKNWV